jgi:hypothetical protein
MFSYNSPKRLIEAVDHPRHVLDALESTTQLSKQRYQVADQLGIFGDISTWWEVSLGQKHASRLQDPSSSDWSSQWMITCCERESNIQSCREVFGLGHPL